MKFSTDNLPTKLVSFVSPGSTVCGELALLFMAIESSMRIFWPEKLASRTSQLVVYN